MSFLYIPWFRLEAWHIPLPLLDQIPIQPFGVLVAIGVLLGSKMAERRAARKGIPPHLVTDAIGFVVGIGFIFAHVLCALFYFPERVLREPLYLFKIWDGLSSFGGFIGAFIGALVWRAKRQKSIFVVVDNIWYAFPLGFIFGRLGCFVVHDHPGKVTTFPLAVADWPVGEPPFMPRHDLGLYEVFWAIGATLLFVWLDRKPRKPGFFFALLPIIYTPIRFFLDFLREVPKNGGDVRYFGLTPGHYQSVLLLVLGIVLMWWVQTHPPAQLELKPEPAKKGSKRTARA